MDGGAQASGQFVGPIQANAIYSNYLAPTLTSILGTTTPPTAAQAGTITIAVSVGRFGGPTLDQPGGATGPATSFLASGDSSQFAEQVRDVLLYLPAGYQGNVTITESWTGSSPGSSAVTVPAVPYDNGSFLADLRGSGANEAGPAPASQAPPAQGGAAQAPPQAPAATGVRGGIDWSTLKPLGPGNTGGNGDPVTTGTLWTVMTVGGKPITVFSADPLAQQPAASTALPGVPGSVDELPRLHLRGNGHRPPGRDDLELPDPSTRGCQRGTDCGIQRGHHQPSGRSRQGRDADGLLRLLRRPWR